MRKVGDHKVEFWGVTRFCSFDRSSSGLDQGVDGKVCKHVAERYHGKDAFWECARRSYSWSPQFLYSVLGIHFVYDTETRTVSDLETFPPKERLFGPTMHFHVPLASSVVHCFAAVEDSRVCYTTGEDSLVVLTRTNLLSTPRVVVDEDKDRPPIYGFGTVENVVRGEKDSFNNMVYMYRKGNEYVLSDWFHVDTAKQNFGVTVRVVDVGNKACRKVWGVVYEVGSGEETRVEEGVRRLQSKVGHPNLSFSTNFIRLPGSQTYLSLGHCKFSSTSTTPLPEALKKHVSSRYETDPKYKEYYRVDRMRDEEDRDQVYQNDLPGVPLPVYAVRRRRNDRLYGL